MIKKAFDYKDIFNDDIFVIEDCLPMIDITGTKKNTLAVMHRNFNEFAQNYKRVFKIMTPVNLYFEDAGWNGLCSPSTTQSSVYLSKNLILKESYVDSYFTLLHELRHYMQFEYYVAILNKALTDQDEINFASVVAANETTYYSSGNTQKDYLIYYFQFMEFDANSSALNFLGLFRDNLKQNNEGSKPFMDALNTAIDEHEEYINLMMRAATQIFGENYYQIINEFVFNRRK